MSLRTLILALACLAAAPAFAGDLADRLLAVDGSWTYVDDRDALVLDDSVSDADLDALTDHADWRVRHQADIVLGWRNATDAYVAVAQMAPIQNRAGRYRYVVDAVEHPAAFGAMLERYLHRGEPLLVREGLFAAMVERAPDWADVARGLFEREPEPTLRVVIVAAMRKVADAEAAHDVLRVALTDPSVEVRAEAAVSIGWREDGAALADDLLATLSDEATQPRAMAARALGWLSVPEAAESLEDLLVDAEPDVRLHALRSIRRIDVPKAKALTALPQLLQDGDPRVSKQARKIVSMQ